MLINFDSKENIEVFLKKILEIDHISKDQFINPDGFLDCEPYINEQTFNHFKTNSIIVYHITKSDKEQIKENGLLTIRDLLKSKDNKISKLLLEKNIELDFESKTLIWEDKIFPLDFSMRRLGCEYMSLCRRIIQDYRVDNFYIKPKNYKEYPVIYNMPEILFDLGKFTDNFYYFIEKFNTAPLLLVKSRLDLSEANIDKKFMIDMLDNMLEYLFNNHRFHLQSYIISTATGKNIPPHDITFIEEFL
ncbi:hypothetical protein QL845_001049 [Enterococcus faecium]|nr:hypothetical protein [Enterococcus faecium]